MRSKGISIILPLFFILFYGQGYASAMDETPELYVHETTVAFQAVHEGAHVQHAFVVQNKGKATLDILEVKTD